MKKRILVIILMLIVFNLEFATANSIQVTIKEEFQNKSNQLDKTIIEKDSEDTDDTEDVENHQIQLKHLSGIIFNKLDMESADFLLPLSENSISWTDNSDINIGYIHWKQNDNLQESNTSIADTSDLSFSKSMVSSSNLLNTYEYNTDQSTFENYNKSTLQLIDVEIFENIPSIFNESGAVFITADSYNNYAGDTNRETEHNFIFALLAYILKNPMVLIAILFVVVLAGFIISWGLNLKETSDEY